MSKKMAKSKAKAKIEYEVNGILKKLDNVKHLARRGYVNMDWYQKLDKIILNSLEEIGKTVDEYDKSQEVELISFKL